jgi:hypothetical protein
MKKIHLINNTYQVWNDDETTCLFQGTSDECDERLNQLKLKYMSPRAQQFIELQTQVNNLIDSTDGPTDQLIQLTGELELLGDSLNNDEIHEVCEWYNSRQEIEWGIE